MSEKNNLAGARKPHQAKNGRTPLALSFPSALAGSRSLHLAADVCRFAAGKMRCEHSCMTKCWSLLTGDRLCRCIDAWAEWRRRGHVSRFLKLCMNIATLCTPSIWASGPGSGCEVSWHYQKRLYSVRDHIDLHSQSNALRSPITLLASILIKRNLEFNLTASRFF